MILSEALTQLEIMELLVEAVKHGEAKDVFVNPDNWGATITVNMKRGKVGTLTWGDNG
ncbi:MAG: hypothetical protein GY833_16430 [Aestuariibacter sp.]|nr:hypothetical protein [Aestuariibacter sp.]